MFIDLIHFTNAKGDEKYAMALISENRIRVSVISPSPRVLRAMEPEHDYRIHSDGGNLYIVARLVYAFVNGFPGANGDVEEIARLIKLIINF